MHRHPYSPLARSRLVSWALVAAAGVAAMAPCGSAQIANWDLLTVSDTNTLMRVDLDVTPFPATALGVTQDAAAAGGTVRRIRGLAYAGSTLYGMTREGDLVTVNDQTGETSFVYSIGTGTSTQFWSGLTYEPASNALYTVNPFGGTTQQNLVRIDLNTLTHTVQGPTVLSGTSSPFQMLGVTFMTLGGAPTLLASNRQNQCIVEMDPATGQFVFTWGSATSGVNNPQQIAVHPGTGVLWGIHDSSPTSINAGLSTFAAATMQSTFAGELSFGIVERVGGGGDTYGWGGIAFTQVGPVDTRTLTTRFGRCDCFAPPPDPSSPRPALVAFSRSINPNPGPATFDDLDMNEWFAQSFENLPMGCIVSGTLTVTARPLGSSANDTFRVGQVNGPGTTLGNDFAAWRYGDFAGGLAALFPGAPWHTSTRPDPCGYTAVIDLNVPVGAGPDTLIDRMNALGVLDVFAEDDTSIDCLVLDLQVDPACMPTKRCAADFDGDGKLDIFDFLAFQDAFSLGCP